MNVELEGDRLLERCAATRCTLHTECRRGRCRRVAQGESKWCLDHRAQRRSLWLTRAFAVVVLLGMFVLLLHDFGVI